MDNFLYNSLLTYFNTLNTLGYVNNKDTYKLIILSTIQELFKEWEYFITEEDYKYLTNALYCLYGSNCILPYPSNLGKNTLSYNLNGGITNPDINGIPGYINPEEGDNSKCYCLNMFERAEMLTHIQNEDFQSSVITEKMLKGLPDVIQLFKTDGYWANKDFTIIKPFQYEVSYYIKDILYKKQSIDIADLVDLNTNDVIHYVFPLKYKLPKAVLPLITEIIMTSNLISIYDKRDSFYDVDSNNNNIIFSADAGCPIYVKRDLNTKRLFDTIKIFTMNDDNKIDTKYTELTVPVHYSLGITYNKLKENENLVGCLSGDNYQSYDAHWYANNEMHNSGQTFFTLLPGTCLKTAYINNNHEIVLVIRPYKDSWNKLISIPNNNTIKSLILGLSKRYNSIYNVYINKEKLLKNFKI